MKKTEILIIGAGIAGAAAALYLKQANVSFLIIDSNDIGGYLVNLKTIENYPGYENVTGLDLVKSLKDQFAYNSINLFKENVQTILKDKDGFEVKTDKESYIAKAVIIATGGGLINKTIPGEEKYFGSGVSYCATCDANFYKGLDVAVIGDNNIALDEALYLSNIVKKVYLVCTYDELIGDKDLISKVKITNNIEVRLRVKVDEICGDDFGVTSIKIANEKIDVAGVFPYIGQKSTTQILKNLSPNMNGKYIVVNEENMTNIPGLYAAGDIVSKKLKQLITAAGDGANAAQCAVNYIKLLS